MICCRWGEERTANWGSGVRELRQWERGQAGQAVWSLNNPSQQQEPCQPRNRTNLQIQTFYNLHFTSNNTKRFPLYCVTLSRKWFLRPIWLPWPSLTVERLGLALPSYCATSGSSGSDLALAVALTSSQDQQTSLWSSSSNSYNNKVKSSRYLIVSPVMTGMYNGFIVQRKKIWLGELFEILSFSI